MANNELDLALANVARLLNLATWMAIDNPERVTHEERDGYFTNEDESEQLTALLIVTRDYAERKLAEHDNERAKAREGGAS